MWVVRYNWDRAFDTAWFTLEFICVSPILIFLGYKFIETYLIAQFGQWFANIWYYSFDNVNDRILDGSFGALTFLLLFSSTLPLSLKLFYNYISILYIYDVKKYPLGDPYPVKFYPWWDFQIYEFQIDKVTNRID